MLYPWHLLWGEEVAPHTKEAYFYRRLSDDRVQCETCPHTCVITPGNRGRCRTKTNKGGRLFSLSYGNPCVVHVDPIEKKPLLHFYPGTKTFSLAVAGCNFHCLNCQNWEISQTTPDKTRNYNLPPEKVVGMASDYGCTSIAFTYSEATTFYEYMVDIAVAARKKGLKSVWVSNGFINEPALHRLCDVIDGASVNLKAFSDDIYRELIGGHLDPVLRTFQTLHRRGVWFEIINLIVPTYTDDMEMIKRMCGWIVDHLGPGYPLHFSRFFPQYKLVHLPPTPVEVLEKAQDIARETGLSHVYIGNVPGGGDRTLCPQCNETIISRRGYTILDVKVRDGRCAVCKTVMSGRWDL